MITGEYIDRGNLKHSVINRLEFVEIHARADVNYFDLKEDCLLAWNNVAYKSVSNNR